MKKEWIKIAVIFFVTVGTVFLALNYLFLSGKTAQKSKAAGETIELSYNPSSVTAAAGQDFSVIVRMRPTNNVSFRGYYFRLPFDKTKLQLKSIEYKLGVASRELFGQTNSDLSEINQSGAVLIQGEIQNSSGYIVGTGSIVELTRLVFTATTAQGQTLKPSHVYFYTGSDDGTISLTTLSGSTLTSLNVNGGDAAATCTDFTDNFLDTDLDADNWSSWSNNNGTFSILNGALQVRTPASTDGAFKSSSVYTRQLISGDFVAEVLLKSTSVASGSGYVVGLGFYGDPFDGFGIERQNDGRMRLLYDWNNTDWVSPQIINTSLSVNTPVKVKLERSGTTLKFYHDLLDGAGYRLDKTFSGGYTGSGKISLYVNNSAPNFPDIMGRFDDFKLDCLTATLTGTPAPTPTGSIPVTGNTKIDLKLKFQGITSKPADARNSMNVKFTLSGADLTTPLVKSGTFAADANGVWSGRVGFDLTSPAGKKYILYVKGPRHVQKKVCDIVPTESNQGTYSCANPNFTLALGDNSRDLSKILLLSGDIYGPDKVQDGVVNSVDLSFVKNNLNKTDAATLAVCDINLDGGCDTQDYSLILSSLSIKSDEL